MSAPGVQLQLEREKSQLPPYHKTQQQQDDYSTKITAARMPQAAEEK